MRVWGENRYWKKLEEAEYMVRPFCDASFLIQIDGNTMSHVLLVCFNLWKHLSGLEIKEEVDEMLSDLESRFKREEFHLLFLAFLVHVVFHQVAIKILDESDKNNGNYTDKKIVFQGRDFSQHQSFTTRSINYTKKVPQQRLKKEEENILKTRL